jgi:hypothetical protein
MSARLLEKAETSNVTPFDKPLLVVTVKGKSTVTEYSVPGGCLQSFWDAPDRTSTTGAVMLGGLGLAATKNCPVATGLTPEAQGDLPVYVACTDRE